MCSGDDELRLQIEWLRRGGGAAEEIAPLDVQAPPELRLQIERLFALQRPALRPCRAPPLPLELSTSLLVQPGYGGPVQPGYGEGAARSFYCRAPAMNDDIDNTCSTTRAQEL
jgi:hypothetical protein